MDKANAKLVAAARAAKPPKRAGHKHSRRSCTTRAGAYGFRLFCLYMNSKTLDFAPSQSSEINPILSTVCRLPCEGFLSLIDRAEFSLCHTRRVVSTRLALCVVGVADLSVEQASAIYEDHQNCFGEFVDLATTPLVVLATDSVCSVERTTWYSSAGRFWTMIGKMTSTL